MFINEKKGPIGSFFCFNASFLRYSIFCASRASQGAVGCNLMAEVRRGYSKCCLACLVLISNNPRTSGLLIFRFLFKPVRDLLGSISRLIYGNRERDINRGDKVYH